MLVDQQDAAADQHEAAELRPAKGLVPHQMGDDRDRGIACRDRRKRNGYRYLLQRDDVQESGENVDREADNRQRMANCVTSVCELTAPI